MTNFHLLQNKRWVAGVIAVTVITAIIYSPQINQRLSSDAVESRCMRVLEETAKAARLKSPEEHAQAIFHTMATPDCKAYASRARS